MCLTVLRKVGVYGVFGSSVESSRAVTLAVTMGEVVGRGQTQVFLCAPVGLHTCSWGSGSGREGVCFKYLGSVARNLYWKRVMPQYFTDTRKLNRRLGL